MQDTASKSYSDLRDLSDRLTALQRARSLTLEDDPDGTHRAVTEALGLLDAAAERVAKLETLETT